MSTQYQAQVKMTANAKPSPVRTEATALAAASPASNDPQSKRSKSPSRGPVSLHNQSISQHAIEEAPHAAQRIHTTRVGYEISKRILDVVLGSILLVPAIPLIGIAALAIRADTKGSPFFSQTRLGKNGKPFKIFKLRGMYIDARTRFSNYYDYSKHQDLEFCFHHEHDPRVTRAGRFLRRTSIDELPNLWNVVLGDMSLVGPRPEIPEVLALYGSYREEYLSVKPGVTCLSKCTGRDRLTKRETIDLDIGYVRARSFSLDQRILWRTFCSVVLRRDVF